MASKYDQLTKLKDLLDAGTLTQEEFDAAKKRILDTEDSTNISPMPPIPNDNKAPVSLSKYASKKWILWGIGGVLAIIIMLIVVCNKRDVSQINTNGNQDWDAAKAESDAQFEEALAMAADMNEDDGLSIGNPWRKEYFRNEWGEEITDSPFIYTVLDGTGWKIQIDFIPPTQEWRWGMFRFYLLDNDYRKTSSYGPINILVRGSDGETRVIDVAETRDGITYVIEPSAITLLSHYLDQETFDIRMEFDKYNERHATQARWEASPGSYGEAINKLLNI